MALTRLAPFSAPPAQVVAALDALRQRHGVVEDFGPEARAEAEAAATAWDDGGPERFLATGKVVDRDGSGGREEGGHRAGGREAGTAPVRDARDLALVTIDPPGSMDLDQAVLLERLAGGSSAAYRVSYAIASVSTFVTPGGPLDAELHRRGCTVYAPDRAVALHPEALSHGAASLLPGADRPACLWTIELDAAGRRLSARVERALVRSRARLSYDEVQAVLDAGPGEGPRLPEAVPADLHELLREIGTLRQAREAARGGVSLAAPEQQIRQVDPADPSAGYHLVLRASLPVEEWNAQISLLAGMSAAQIMIEAGVGVLRTMPPAQSADYARLRRMAKALRITWPDAQPYAELVRSLRHDIPAHAAFMDQAMSLFRGAGYLAFGVGGVPVPADDEADDSEEAVHAAIAARYAHVTAPLRRLVDRYGEEICIAACAGRPAPHWVRRALPGLPRTMDTTGRRARAVARGAVAALEALVLAGHEGEVFDGAIISVREGRGEVVLPGPGVIGTVRAQRGATVPLGEFVRVRLAGVDVAQGRFDLELV